MEIKVIHNEGAGGIERVINIPIIIFYFNFLQSYNKYIVFSPVSLYRALSYFFFKFKKKNFNQHFDYHFSFEYVHDIGSVIFWLG